MTYEHLFQGEMLLCGALHHVAQASAVYSTDGAVMLFRTSDGEESFALIENSLKQIREERARKRRIGRRAA